jgi:hypothetical protein
MKCATAAAATLATQVLLPYDALAADAPIGAPTYQTLTGCLELSPSGGYVLRGSEADTALRQAGGMEKHVGRTVRVTGEWQDDADGRRLRVARIELVTEGCGP